MIPPIKIAIYETKDDVPAAHRYVGYFYLGGEVMPIIFRGMTPEIIREKITSFHESQSTARSGVDGRTKEGRALRAQKTD